MTTTLELEVSEKIVRKLKALSALEGYKSPAQMVAKASEILESALDAAISGHLGPQMMGIPMQMPVEQGPAPTRMRKPFEKELEHSYDGLSNELGDEADYDSEEPLPELDAFAMVPKSGGLSDEDIEHDMDVEDPEHEAAAEPPLKAGPNDDAEDLFVSLSGIPLRTEDPEEEDESGHWIARRKRRNTSKAKVTGLLEDAQISEIF